MSVNNCEPPISLANDKIAKRGRAKFSSALHFKTSVSLEGFLKYVLRKQKTILKSSGKYFVILTK